MRDGYLNGLKTLVSRDYMNPIQLLYSMRVKESSELQITGKRKGNVLPKMKRSPEERHTQTHRNLLEMF